MMTIGFLIAMLFLFMILMGRVGIFWALAIEIMTIFGFFVIIGADKFVPESMMSEQMQMFVWFMQDLGSFMGYVFIGIAFVVFLWKKKEKAKEWWRKERKWRFDKLRAKV